MQQEGIGSGFPPGPMPFTLRDIAMRSIKTTVKVKVVRYKFYRDEGPFCETECRFGAGIHASDTRTATSRLSNVLLSNLD